MRTYIETLDCRRLLSAAVDAVATPTLGTLRWQGADVNAAVGRYIVTLKHSDGVSALSTFDSAPNDKLASILERAAFPIKFENYLGDDNSFTVVVPTQTTESDLRAFFGSVGNFVGIDPDLAGDLASISVSDPYFSSQGWHSLSDTNGSNAAWDLTTGSDSTAVAVLDSGVNLDHPDLTANRYLDANGNVSGKDFVSPGSLPYDHSGHGTNVAGILMAKGNSIGVSGVMRQGRFISVRVTDAYTNALDVNGVPDTDLYLSRVVAGINYVCQLNEAGVNVRVINASLYIRQSYYSDISSLTDAVSRASGDGIMIVCAAGNDTHRDITPSGNGVPVLPASLSAAVPGGRAAYTNVISVAATGDGPQQNANELADFSNLSATAVQLAAPGVNTFTTTWDPTDSSRLYDDQTHYTTYGDPTPSLKQINGTSMATPQVAGTIGLILSMKPDLNITQIRTALQNGIIQPSDHNSLLYQKTQWHGRLDVGAVVHYVNNNYTGYSKTLIGDIGGNPVSDNFAVHLHSVGSQVDNTQVDLYNTAGFVATIPNLASKKIGIFGLANNDYITVDSGVNNAIYVSGGLGNDTIATGNGNDTVLGDTGDDIIHGGGGADYLSGLSGNDTIYGDGGADTLYGGNGNDQFFAKDSVIDSLFGDAGTDRASLVANERDSNDVLNSIETSA